MKHTNKHNLSLNVASVSRRTGAKHIENHAEIKSLDQERATAINNLERILG